MLNFCLFLFFIFMEFLFLTSFYLSMFFLLFQSMFFNLFFLSFLANIPSKEEKGLKGASYSLEFFFSYIFYETILLMIFFLSYFFNFFMGYIFICLFKQGTFPFLFYNFMLNNLNLKYKVMKNYISIFLIISKVWVMILYGKTVFCLSFYCFFLIISLVMIFLSFDSKILTFLGVGFTLNNLVMGILCHMVNLMCMFSYSIMSLVLYKMCFSWLFNNSSFIGADLKFLYSMLMLFVNGTPFIFFISMKFIFLLVLGSYSMFLIYKYSLVSVMLMFYSMVKYLNIFGENYNNLMKLDYGYFSIFILFMIFLSFTL